MELSKSLVLPSVRCAAVHGSQAVDPAGTAPRWDAVMAVEVPLPWGKDIGSSAPFTALMASPEPVVLGADGRRWRPQGLVPATGAGSAGTRVIAWERSVGEEEVGGPYARREWVLGDQTAVVDLLEALLAADAAALEGFEGDRDDAPEGTVDLLVCTHGTRDVCCGGSGAAMYQELRDRLGDSDGVRLWRSSHTGGHRFAPTAVSMPDGVAWAHLTASIAEQLVRRDGDAADLAQHCRGALSVEPGVAQVADREALALFGWHWCSAERRVVVVAHERDTLATSLEVHGRWDDGRTAAMAVRVELDRHIAMPTCGAVAGPEFTTEPVWRALDARIL